MSKWPTPDEIKAMFPTKEGFGKTISLVSEESDNRLIAYLYAALQVEREHSDKLASTLDAMGDVCNSSIGDSILSEHKNRRKASE